jgi:hypothetical protein
MLDLTDALVVQEVRLSQFASYIILNGCIASFLRCGGKLLELKKAVNELFVSQWTALTDCASIN